MNNDILFLDCCANFMEFKFDESTDKNGLVKFRGKFQEANAVNKNKRMYPHSVLAENVRRLQEAIESRQLIGELDHPTDSIIHFATASHIVTKLWWDGQVLMGEGEILNTPHGKILKALINDGVKVGISSRGIGSGKLNEDGILVIGESFRLITFDAVADPSTYSAFQEKVVSAPKREHTSLPSWATEGIRNNADSIKTTDRNEGRGIDRSSIKKEAVIACLGGIIKSQSAKYRG